MKRVYEILRSRASRRFGQWALRAIGPIVLAVLLVRFVDYDELRTILGDMQLGWGLAALASVQLIILLRTYRWVDIHRTFGLPAAPFGYQLRLSYATNFATLALPQILSPFSRLVLLLQDGYRADRAAAGSALEKLLELVSYLAFGVYGCIVLASVFAGLVWWAAGLSLAGLAAGAALYLARAHLGRLVAALIERLPSAPEAADSAVVAEQLVALSRTVLTRLSLWSLAIALTQATMLYFLARSLGVDLSYPYIVGAWGVIALSMLLPVSINGIGTREAVLVVAFDAADRSTDAAVALGLLVLVVVALGSAPGAFEWLYRSLAGSGRPAAAGERPVAPAGVPPATPASGKPKA